MRAERQFRIDRTMGLYPGLPGVATESVVLDEVDAVWYRPPQAESGRVVLYIHGGGFMWSSALGHCGMISRVAAQSSCDVLALDYDVAPFSRFPVPVNEGVRLYRQLLTSGYAASKIAMVGDSCGGGLVMSVLSELKRLKLALPGCAAITSAYTDLTNRGESIDWVTLDPCVSREGLEVCATEYLQGHDPMDPLASPLHGDLSGLPPMLLQVGSREQLLSDSTRFAAKAEAQGVKVTLEVYDGCVHLWHWWAPDAPESKAALQRIGEFVRAYTR